VKIIVWFDPKGLSKMHVTVLSLIAENCSKQFHEPIQWSQASYALNDAWILYLQFIYLSGFVTAVAVFRKPNAIPLCFCTDLVLNFLLSWLLVLLPSTFFLDVLFSFSPVVFAI